MSLFNQIMTAQGDSSAAYLKGGRHVGKIARTELRDPSTATGTKAEMKPGFKFDIEILASNRADFGTDNEGAFKKGDIGRATDPFRFPKQALARVRKLVSVALTSQTGSAVDEATLGLVRNDGEDDKAFAKRYADHVENLINGTDQPLTGAVVTVIITEGKNKETGKPYSLFDVVLPTKDDLVNAGLLPAE
jgi:hypothetical protein